MFNQFYNNKKVLVLGHTGFKGAWLTQWLLSLGADVTGISSYIPSNPSLFEVLKLKDQIHDCREDIRDLDKIINIFQEVKPDIVFHLAAQPIVKQSYINPKETFNINLGGTVNVLEAIRTTESVKTAILITSDKCYDNVEWEYGYRENDRLGGKDPYSASKACAEIAINAYWHSFLAQTDKKIASVRAGNVIGGGDWAAHRIVPDAMRAWSKNQSVTLRAPSATRPWQHVLEPLSGYLWLGACLSLNSRKDLSGEAFNFGPEASVNYPVAKLIEDLACVWPEAKWSVDKSNNELKEAGLLKLSCDKALYHLNWAATLSFAETVTFTSQWYVQFYKSADMQALTCEQIEAYSDLAHKREHSWTSPQKTPSMAFA